MSLKLRALGLGLLAMLATSAFAVMNATAETGGHFVSSVHHTTVVGTETEPNHKLEFTVEGIPGGITCTKSSYHGTAVGTTVTELTIVPNWSECFTTGSTTKFEIDENGCHFLFTVGKSVHNTVHLNCPPTKTIEITHPSCRIHVPPQTVNGVAYETVTENGKHAITLKSTVSNITTHFESGICIFTGTNHSGIMHGSATVNGVDTDGNSVDITATG